MFDRPFLLQAPVPVWYLEEALAESMERVVFASQKWEVVGGVQQYQDEHPRERIDVWIYPSHHLDGYGVPGVPD
jgi:hypothetical protein